MSNSCYAVKAIIRHAVLDTAFSSRKHWIAGQARNDVDFFGKVRNISE